MRIRDAARAGWQQRWWLAVIVAGLSVVIYGIYRFWLGPQVLAYSVLRGELVQTVVASGRVETPLRVEIGSQLTSTVAAIPVMEGQTVQAVQLLIALDDREALAAVAQSRAAVTQAQTRLQQIRELSLPVAQQAVRQAEANWRNAAQHYDRTRILQGRGFVGQAQLDEAQRNLDVAQSQWRTAQLQFESNSTQGSDVRLAQAALEQAEASLHMAQAKLRYTRITAPTAGTLITRAIEPGNVVQPGKVLMVLSPEGKTQLVVQIDERNMAAVQLGQPALSAADAYPNQRFAATVSYINPAVDSQRGSVEIKLDVATPPSYLRQDMTVSVDIEVARRPDTLILSAEAIHDAATAAPWVLKIMQGRVARQAVKLGIRSTGKMEILEGLQAGDQVISATAVNVAVGQHIRARRVAVSSAQPFAEAPISRTILP